MVDVSLPGSLCQEMYYNNYSMNNLDVGFNVSSMEVHNPEDNSEINISDVIEVIETDTAFGGGPMQSQRTGSSRDPGKIRYAEGVYVRVIEQPAPKALRFRYECEGRSAGSLPGVNSTSENKTYPTIQIVGYTGRAVVVVSCVTKDPPYRPHPHNLVGRENCKKGVCTMEVSGEGMTASFANLGIQCVKKKDIEEALRLREGIRVDPFKTGFSHKTQASSIDLNSVRLCFQVFLEGPPGKFMNPVRPVVSEPIYDKKAVVDLVLCEVSHFSGSVAGGQKVLLFCEKVAKDDIAVRFFEEKDGQQIWEGYGDFTPGHVHKQTAIKFETPRYRTVEIEDPVQVYMQLQRPSDGETSNAMPFTFTPLSESKRKRQRQNESSGSQLRSLTDIDASLRMNNNEGMVVKKEPVLRSYIYGMEGRAPEATPVYIREDMGGPGSGPPGGFPPPRHSSARKGLKLFVTSPPPPHGLLVAGGGGGGLRKLSPAYSRTPSPMMDYSQQQSQQTGGGGTSLLPPAQHFVFSQMGGGTTTYITSSSTGGGHVYAAFQQPPQQHQQQPQQHQQPQQPCPLQPQPAPSGSLRQEPTNILDMDTQECSFEMNFMSRLNSRELVDIQMLEGALPNSFSSSLNLGELGSNTNNGPQQQHQSVAAALQQHQLSNSNTDSFTRLANAAINDLYQ